MRHLTDKMKRTNNIQTNNLLCNVKKKKVRKIIKNVQIRSAAAELNQG